MIVQFKKNENSDKRKQIKADLQTLIIKVIYQEYTLFQHRLLRCW